MIVPEFVRVTLYQNDSFEGLKVVTEGPKRICNGISSKVPGGTLRSLIVEKIDPTHFISKGYWVLRALDPSPDIKLTYGTISEHGKTVTDVYQ